jgi:2-oxoisovalerate dehydrogenase E1 component
MASFDAVIAAQILYIMKLINRFEKALIDLQGRHLLWGALHTSIGVEGPAAAAIQALGTRSRITSTHRGHHHHLSKGICHILGERWNPLKETDTTALRDFLEQTFAEILGLRTGFSGGRGGSMHLYFPEAGIYGTNGIVGGGIPTAVGMAFSAKYFGLDDITMTFFGDGAINQGTFHESCNLAGVFHLPIIFFVENNQYAVGTKASESCAIRDLALRGISYGFPAFKVEGDDILAVHDAVGRAVAGIRSGTGPYLIESLCYRPLHHDSSLPGSAYGYRSKDEEAEWAKKSAMQKYPAALVESGKITAADIGRFEQEIDRLIADSISPLLRADGSAIVESLWPSPATIADGVRSSGEEFKDIQFTDERRGTRNQDISYVNAIAKIAGRWMERRHEVVEWGEEVANFRSGPYGATKELMKKFPDQVRNTPISEAAFTGMALGACTTGIKPIVELMFPDFALVCADQLFNQIGKARYMFGAKNALGIVLRTRIGTGTGMGPQHSMDAAALFALFSGWRIIAPSNAYDYIGLFNTAMVSTDPVLILEHNLLYAEKGSIPVDDELDYYIPFGRARVVTEGSDITIVTYGGMVRKAEAAVKELSDRHISAEIIDLRSIDDASIDYQCIGDSIKKTGSMVFVEESIASQALGDRISYHTLVRFGQHLRKVPLHLTSADVPMPVSKVLEKAAILDAAEIVKSIISYLDPGT